MTLTVTEAAILVGVKPATVRSWVKRGHLKPIYPSWTGVVKFNEEDVQECRRLRRSKAEQERFDANVTRWRAECLAIR